VMGKTALRAGLMHGKLDATIVDAVMYGGTGNASVSIDTNIGGPVIQSNITLTQVQLEPLLKDVNGSKRFSGAADLRMSLYAHGASERDMIQSLTGRGEGKVDKGVLRGINIADMVKNVATSFKPDSGQQTAFSNIAGTFLINQGVLSNKDLVLNAPTVNVSGAGEMNLPQQTIHYRLTPQMLRTSQDLAAGPKAGLAVPIIIEGSLDNPTYHPDVGAVLQDALKDPKQFREELKNSRGSLKDQLKDPKKAIKDIKGLLKGL
jgi:AsmA protein